MSAEILSPFGSSPEIPQPAASGLSSIDSSKPQETTRDKWKRHSKTALVTVGTFAATEGAAHAGGTVSAAADTLSFIHNPKTLLGAVVLSYVPVIKGLGGLSQENNTRIRDREARIAAGELDATSDDKSLYYPSVIARRRMQQRIDKGKLLYKVATWHERIDPEKKGIGATVKRKIADTVSTDKLLNAAGHRSFAVPHLWGEVYYNGLAGVSAFVSDLQAGGSFVVGANLAAAGWLSLQKDGAAHMRETDSREGIIKGVVDKKKERLKAKAKTIYYSKALSLASQVHI